MVGDEFFELSLSSSEDDMLSCGVVEQRMWGNLENVLKENEEAVVGLFAPAENADASATMRDRLPNKENSRK